MRFADRTAAGRALAEQLCDRDVAADVVLGIARGGVVVAAEVAKRLNAELGVVVVRKLTAPRSRELTLGAVANGVARWIDHARVHALGVPVDHLARETERQLRECARLEAAFARFGTPRVGRRRVLVVDDAISSGGSCMLAVRRVRAMQPGAVEVAVPVATEAGAARLRAERVDPHCLAVERSFAWAGAFYDDFRTIDEQDVCRVLARNRGACPVRVRRPAIARDGISLAAVLELPEGEGPFPAVLLVHGAGDDKESAAIVALAERLRGDGMATLRFDLSGTGGSTSSPEAAPTRFMGDLAAVFAWALECADLDRRRLAIFGQDLGAWVALRGTIDGQIGPAVLALRAPPIQRDDLVGLGVECLLLCGDQDTNLPGVARAAEQCPLARLEIVTGTGQRFTEPSTSESASRLVADWLAEKLSSHPAAAR